MRLPLTRTSARCAFAPVWDVGPWNTRDDYWNAPGTRENWGDLPQGMPQSIVITLPPLAGLILKRD